MVIVPVPRLSVRDIACSNIGISSIDQLAESRNVACGSRLQFHMSHAFASSLQQPGRVIEKCAVEETHVDVVPEGVHVSEHRIPYAGDRAAVVHQFADIVTALPHVVKPPFRHRTQFARLIVQPAIDSRISFDTSGKPEDVLISGHPADIQGHAGSMRGHGKSLSESDSCRSRQYLVHPDKRHGYSPTFIMGSFDRLVATCEIERLPGHRSHELDSGKAFCFRSAFA